ncbi:uncharacterized protein LOC119898146 isoform X2 [Micropterus salmoides]|uniref:uncharacterized protein LOC119898146 isoform X1 n=1 Tax=Micropterus salmoides TaxID=27706 RepID=UPI0018EE0EE3|nr:uncharacterized protein LOC119898146 isoform X1 [Micropterus salmoides]XP_038568262.1 uncharacterized protein LOC119898146 isoform X2 [Micropterus salmoides]
MAVLCWMAVTLGLFLSAGNSLADVDQNKLAGIVTEILKRYRPTYMGSRGQRRRPMFSLAVSIPFDSGRNIYDIGQVTDTRDQVWQRILNRCEVYTSQRMVAATVLRWPNVVDQCPEGRVQWSIPAKCGQTWADVQNLCPTVFKDGRADHAEYRTLQNFNTLVSDHDENDLLLFYVLASPCDKRCASESSRLNILNSIKMIKQWKNYAVVFSDVFKPRGSESIPEQDLRGAIERLGQSVGLSNIFRCNGDVVQCTSCSSGTQVTPYCYSDTAQPGPSHNLPSTSYNQPQRGRRRSPSQGGQSDRGKQSNNISPRPGVSTNVDSGGQGGTVSGGGKRRRKRKKGKKSNNTNDSVSASQSGLGVSNADVDSNTGGGQGGTGSHTVRKVGGRRVWTKGRVRGNKPKSQQGKSKKKKQTNKKKKTQNKGRKQWSQDVQGRAKKQKGQKGKQQQRQRGGEIRRIDQPQKRRKRRRG